MVSVRQRIFSPPGSAAARISPRSQSPATLAPNRSGGNQVSGMWERRLRGQTRKDGPHIAMTAVGRRPDVGGAGQASMGRSALIWSLLVISYARAQNLARSRRAIAMSSLGSKWPSGRQRCTRSIQPSAAARESYPRKLAQRCISLRRFSSRSPLVENDRAGGNWRTRRAGCDTSSARGRAAYDCRAGPRGAERRRGRDPDRGAAGVLDGPGRTPPSCLGEIGSGPEPRRGGAAHLIIRPVYPHSHGPRLVAARKAGALAHRRPGGEDSILAVALRARPDSAQPGRSFRLPHPCLSFSNGA
jgi:hypothetical protein